MITIATLWLPILVSGVVVFLASFIAWMVLPHHKPDWSQLGDKEAGFFEVLRSLKIPPALYHFPGCEMSEMKDPEVKKRWMAGPHGILHVFAEAPNFGANILKVFLFYVVVSVFVAYLAASTLGAGAEYLAVFRVTGTAAVMGYVLGGIPNDIFCGRSRRMMLMNLLDGIVFGLLTAGVFAWLWPAA